MIELEKNSRFEYICVSNAAHSSLETTGDKDRSWKLRSAARGLKILRASGEV